MGCKHKITVMNCPNWVCGEDGLLCKECGGRYNRSNKTGIRNMRNSSNRSIQGLMRKRLVVKK